MSVTEPREVEILNSRGWLSEIDHHEDAFECRRPLHYIDNKQWEKDGLGAKKDSESI